MTVAVVRVTGQLEFNCGLTHYELSNAFRHLTEMMSCP